MKFEKIEMNGETVYYYPKENLYKRKAGMRWYTYTYQQLLDFYEKKRIQKLKEEKKRRQERAIDRLFSDFTATQEFATDLKKEEGRIRDAFMFVRKYGSEGVKKIIKENRYGKRTEIILRKALNRLKKEKIFISPQWITIAKKEKEKINKKEG